MATKHKTKDTEGARSADAAAAARRRETIGAELSAGILFPHEARRAVQFLRKQPWRVGPLT